MSLRTFRLTFSKEVLDQHIPEITARVKISMRRGESPPEWICISPCPIAPGEPDTSGCGTCLPDLSDGAEADQTGNEIPKPNAENQDPGSSAPTVVKREKELGPATESPSPPVSDIPTEDTADATEVCYKLDARPPSQPQNGGSVVVELVIMRQGHNRACHFDSLAEKLGETGDIGDLHRAIVYSQWSVEATTHDHPDRAVHLSTLGNLLSKRYDQLSNIDDLQQAIVHTQDAVTATPPQDNLYRALRLGDLGTLFKTRFNQTKVMSDIQQAVSCNQEAMELTPEGHLARARCLVNMATCLSVKFEQGQDQGDLQQAISYSREGLRMMPQGHSHRPIHLINLGILLDKKYRQTGILGDLLESIPYTQEALAKTPQNDRNRHELLRNLSSRFSDAYSRTRDMNDLQQEVMYARKSLVALEVAPQNHRFRVGYLDSLSASLRKMYNQTGALDTLQEAISYSQEVLSITTDLVDRGNRLYILAHLLSDRYWQAGAASDLEKAILYAQEALPAPQGSYSRAMKLSILGRLLRERYERTVAMDDLQQAILYAKEALLVAPQDDHIRPVYLDKLANSLALRGTRTGASEDLDQAISYTQEALAATPRDHHDWEGYVANLANHLSTRYRKTGNMDDLQQVIVYGQEALAEIPQDHPRRVVFLYNTSGDLIRRYNRTGGIADIEEAIEYLQDALTLASEDYPYRSLLFQRAAEALLKRYPKTESITDIDDSIAYLKTAWSCSAPHTPPSVRIMAATQLFDHCWWLLELFQMVDSDLGSRYHDSKLLLRETSSILESAVLLIPHAAPRSLERQDQQFRLQDFKLAEKAASAALAAGETVYDALKILELSRGVIMGFAIDCRSDISDLRDANSVLYNKFKDLRAKIDTPLPDGNIVLGGDSDRIMAKQRRAEYIQEMEKTIAEIRDLPGHGGFLLPPSSSELMRIAEDGPIVVFVSTLIRSDAIIVTSSAIRSIELPKLLYGEIPEWRGEIDRLTKVKTSLKAYLEKNAEMRRHLQWLWDVAVKPVVQELKLIARPTVDADLPHIWWIGVGRLSTAPFHAAGDCSQPGERVSSYASSSYTPTIKALLHSRENSLTIVGESSSSESDTKLLLVTMPTTPGAIALPAVAGEALKISQIVHGRVSVQHMPHPTAEDVLGQLKPSACHAIHFACHGVTDSRDPSESHLILCKDGEADKLTVRDVSTKNTQGAQIAYLSACSTAENPSPKLGDETIHIASGFQLAGFSHVLATMWPSNSEICTQVAADFYDSLFSGACGSGHRAVRIAFHRAVRGVQEKYPLLPIKWAPFIHMGA